MINDLRNGLVWCSIWIECHKESITESSVGNSHRSASPRPKTLEEDRELFVDFSSISCLWFEFQGMRTYNFLTELQTLTESIIYPSAKYVQSSEPWLGKINAKLGKCHRCSLECLVSCGVFQKIVNPLRPSDSYMSVNKTIIGSENG